MLLILASRHDAEPARLAAEWGDASACVLTCDDLGVGGWRWTPGRPDRTRLAVAGRVVSAREIRGVLVRLPTVNAAELPRIDSCDRDYVVTELTAFLAAWLNELRCPVLNRPTPVRLDGPAWTRNRWLVEAHRLGIPAATPLQDLKLGVPVDPAPDCPGGCTVTVVGDRCFGAPDKSVSLHASRLAQAAGIALMSARFVSRSPGFEFRDASPCAELGAPEVRAAVFERLRRAA